MKKHRNKKYRPRAIQADPVSWAIAGVSTLMASQQAVLLLKHGAANRDDWNIICQALNVAEALAGMGIGPNLLPQISAGQDALKSIALRMIGRGRTTCYGAELAAIDEALVMYRAQIKLCTQAEMSRAVARVKELHRSGAMDDVGRVFEQMQEAA